MNFFDIHNQLETYSDANALVTIYNDTGKTLTRALAGILRRALSRDYAWVHCLAYDYVVGRPARIGKWRAEVEVYEDGSGLEVAAFGYALILGAEKKGRAMAEESRPAASGAPC